MTASRDVSLVRSTLRIAPILAALAVLTVARPAVASDGAAAAEVLFAEGKRFVQDGNYAAACPKFEESQKLDPGVGTLYRLADCYEHVGRSASAWAAFLEVAAASRATGQQARSEDATKRAAGLEPTLSKLTIRVTAPNGDGMVVKRGDVEVGRAQWGSALPIDPGEVIVEASGRGYKTWRAAVAVSPRGSAQIEIPALEPAPVVEPTGASQPSSVDPHATSEPGQQPFGAQRMVAVVIGATGIVALGVGTVFGLVSISKKSAASKNHCDASNVCDDQGLTLRHDAIKAGNFSSVGFVAGGVLAAAGVILWFTAPSRHQAVRGSAVVPRAGFALLWCGAAFAMELP